MLRGAVRNLGDRGRMPAERVMVGLSGGVDSAVAALRLLEQGWAVEGLFMKNWEEDDTAGYCAAAEDLAQARAVADTLGIRLHTVNFASEYWDRVFEHFLAEYRAGRTPNPDVLCNREIKFKAFLDHALALGSRYIATGHYARNVAGPHGHELHVAADANKDQTYFLYLLDQRALRHAVFPLHDLGKTEVRATAQAAGLPNHARKDSTGICFIGERRFRDFLQRYLPARPGDIVTLDGQRIGRHHGLMFYTIGQRQGLGIGGVADTDDAPWFVTGKDLAANRLLVVQGHDHPALMRDFLLAEQVHWINSPPVAGELRCQARCRHRQPLQDCTARFDGSRLRVVFDRPQRAVTPGQSVVLYDAGRCLGGGIISAGDDA